MASSERMDWPTPRDYFAALDAEFHFTIDACASAENAKLPRFWSEVDEGLMQSWEGERVFMNPPYGRQLPRWIHKAWNESGHADLIVALIPARVDTTYWHDYIIFGHAEIRFLRGRLRFEGAENVAPFPVAVVIWRTAKGWLCTGCGYTYTSYAADQEPKQHGHCQRGIWARISKAHRV